MGKRLQRISGQQMMEKQQQLLNVDLHIVLLNGSSFHGIIERWDQHNCYFKDFRNHKQRILITDIAEIVTDTVSSY